MARVEWRGPPAGSWDILPMGVENSVAALWRQTRCVWRETVEVPGPARRPGCSYLPSVPAGNQPESQKPTNAVQTSQSPGHGAGYRRVQLERCVKGKMFCTSSDREFYLLQF